MFTPASVESSPGRLMTDMAADFNVFAGNEQSCKVKSASFSSASQQRLVPVAQVERDVFLDMSLSNRLIEKVDLPITQPKTWGTTKNLTSIGNLYKKDRAATFRTLEQWTGVVESIDILSKEFTARVVSTTHSEDELADFTFEEVSEDDRELIKEGAVFYWSIGYEVALSKQRSTVSVIRFRRVHLWTRPNLDKADQRALDIANWLQQD